MEFFRTTTGLLASVTIRCQQLWWWLVVVATTTTTDNDDDDDELSVQRRWQNGGAFVEFK